MANTIDVLGADATLDALLEDKLTSFEDDKLAKLGNKAFYYRTALKSIYLPSFQNESSTLQNVFAYSGLEHIGYNDLKSLKTIGQYFFQECKNLTDAVFPSVESISGAAFTGDKNLRSLDFYKKVSFTSNGTFGNTYNLRTIIFRGDEKTNIASNSSLQGARVNEGIGYIYVNDALIDEYKADEKFSNVEIRGISEYPIAHIVGETITDSWDEIKQSESDGSYINKYNIGDTKIYSINGDEYLAEIIGFDLDSAADENQVAHITWLSKNIISRERMNDTETTKGGWGTCALRNHLINDILPTMDIKDIIVPVTKTFYQYKPTVGTQSITDTIWIPSVHELYGANSTGDNEYERSGCDYTNYFQTAESRRRKLGGSFATYWTRTAKSYDTFKCINSYGGGNWTGNDADDEYYVLIGFCT